MKSLFFVFLFAFCFQIVSAQELEFVPISQAQYDEITEIEFEGKKVLAFAYEQDVFSFLAQPNTKNTVNYREYWTFELIHADERFELTIFNKKGLIENVLFSTIDEVYSHIVDNYTSLD